VLAAWILFAFAGFEPWTIAPLALGVAVLALLQRPRIIAPPFTVLDAALIACLAGVALQLMPLTPELRAQLAPGAVAFDRTLRFAGMAGATSGPAPASLETGATRFALIVGCTVTLLFWSARALFARGGLRAAARGIAWIGLVIAPLAIVTNSLWPKLIYGVWRPYATSARPYGPFINRNDLACWLVMAIPLTLGYVVARVASRPSRNIASAVDATAIWLGASICLMLAGLLASVSRSGLTGFAVALLCLAALANRSLTARRAGGVAVASAVMVVIAATYMNPDDLWRKLGALGDGINRRQMVWSFTWTMVRDFWPAGTGLGAYQHAILLYAQPFPEYYINHAHNQYLQFAAEGGLLLVVPGAVAIVAGAAMIARRLRSDRTPVFWIRAGAASGLVGILVQGLLETSFRMPANAVLFALLAAIAMHESGDAHRARVSPNSRAGGHLTGPLPGDLEAAATRHPGRLEPVARTPNDR
jgi:O-antigen ligase